MPVRAIVFASFAISMALNCALLAAHCNWLCIPALLAGWYAADLLSGLVHLTLDYYPCPPERGLPEIYFYEGDREGAHYLSLRAACMARLSVFQRITYDFKNHHPRPDALGRRSLWAQIGVTLMVAALPTSIALNAAAWAGLLPAGWVAFGLTMIVGTAFAQYFHGTLHCATVPRPIALLRRARLLMTPAAHQLHHDSLQRDFATNCGWSNPVVNRLYHGLRKRGWIDKTGLVPQG